MREIRDDPIIRCMERTGYPPWLRQDGEELIAEREDDGTRGKDEDGQL